MSQEYSLGSVDVALTPLARFEEYLQSKGKRITAPRRVLVEQVFSHHEHFDVEKLLADLTRAGHRRVSRPTVYRTLEQLVDAGLLRKMELGGRAVYEHDYGYPSHDHLHCKECNRLIEFHSEEIERIREAVARQNGFRVTGHRLIISGVCSECNQKLRRKKSKLDLV
jgi:Fur family ferric uptake transcriptional regulator